MAIEKRRRSAARSSNYPSATACHAIAPALVLDRMYRRAKARHWQRCESPASPWLETVENVALKVNFPPRCLLRVQRSAFPARASSRDSPSRSLVRTCTENSAASEIDPPTGAYDAA